MREKQIRKRNRNSLKDIILNHIYKNIKLYLIVIIIFIIGVTLGVIFINNAGENEITEIHDYISNFINSLKQDYQIDKTELMKKSIWDNLILIISMWFIGSTVIGLPIVFGIVIYRGFCIGYTVSAIISALRCTKGNNIFIINNIFTKFNFYSCNYIYDN